MKHTALAGGHAFTCTDIGWSLQQLKGALLMTRRISSLLFFMAAFVPLVAYAQQPASKAEITEAFVGKVITLAGFSGGQTTAEAAIGKDGTLNYVLTRQTSESAVGSSSMAGGHYVITDGKICVKYNAGRSDTVCYGIRKNSDGSFSWQIPGRGYVPVAVRQ